LILLANWFPKLKSGILCSFLQARWMISPTVSSLIESLARYRNIHRSITALARTL
jgi:hypothetical protein